MILGTVKLNHGNFQVSGPSNLILWIEALTYTSSSPEVKYAAYETKIAEYFVTCATTNEQIPLTDLKYWNVDRNETYKDAEAALARYND